MEKITEQAFLLVFIGMLFTIMVICAMFWIIKKSKAKPKIAERLEQSFVKSRIISPSLWGFSFLAETRKLLKREKKLNGDEITIYEFDDGSKAEMRTTSKGAVIYFKSLNQDKYGLEQNTTESKKRETTTEVILLSKPGKSKNKLQETDAKIINDDNTIENKLDTLINQEISVSLS